MSDGSPLVIVSDLHLGGGPPFYAFGHKHAAARISLGANASYLNSGTWSTAAWAAAGSRGTWIEINAAAPASANLFRWTGAAEPLADRMVPA